MFQAAATYIHARKAAHAHTQRSHTQHMFQFETMTGTIG